MTKSSFWKSMKISEYIFSLIKIKYNICPIYLLKQFIVNKTINLPGHLWVLQYLELMLDPEQDFPPWSGLGFVQNRDLCWVPVPHGLLHDPKPPHLPQLPFTEKKKRSQNVRF